MNFEEVRNNLKRGIHIYILITNLSDFFEDIECDINKIYITIFDRGVLTQYYNTDSKGFIGYFDTMGYNELKVDQFNRIWFVDKNKAEQQLNKINVLIDELKYNLGEDYKTFNILINKINSQKLIYGNKYFNIINEDKN